MTFENNEIKKEFERNKRALRKEFKNTYFLDGENNKLYFVGFDKVLKENEITPFLLFAYDPGNKNTFGRYTADYIRNKKRGAVI